MAHKRHMLQVLLLLMCSGILCAQEPVPDRFTDIVLGQSLEQVKTRLQSHPLFDYRGDPDISLTPIDRQPIIETQGLGFMSAGIFQFRDEKLYSIILRLNENRMDFFTMYTRLTNTYGEPAYLDPHQTYWEGNGQRMVLEQPVIVKYLDMDVFNRIREESAASKSIDEYTRGVFLDNF